MGPLAAWGGFWAREEAPAPGNAAIEGRGVVYGLLCAEPVTRPKLTLAMWSRTLLKSSRKMVSEAHLKTRASCPFTRISIGSSVLGSGSMGRLSYPPIRIDAVTARHASDGHDDIHDEEDEGQ